MVHQTWIHKAFFGPVDPKERFNKSSVADLVKDIEKRQSLTRPQKVNLLKGLKVTLGEEGSLKLDAEDVGSAVRLIDEAIRVWSEQYQPSNYAQPTDQSDPSIDPSTGQPYEVDPNTGLPFDQSNDPSVVPTMDLGPDGVPMYEEVATRPPRREALAGGTPVAPAMVGGKVIPNVPSPDMSVQPKPTQFGRQRQAAQAGGQSYTEEDGVRYSKANRFLAFSPEERRVLKEAIAQYGNAN